MTAATDAPDVLRPGDRVEFLACSPLYAMGLRSATVVSAGERLCDRWERQAPQLGVSVAWLRRRVVARYRELNGRPPPPGWEHEPQLVVKLDAGGPVWVQLEVGIAPAHVRRAG